MNGMNGMKKKKPGAAQRSRISSGLLVQYFLALAAYLVALAVGGLAAWVFAHQFTWQGYELIYVVLALVREYLPAFAGAAVLAGWVVISYLFLSKPLRYLDAVVAAAEQLASPTAKPIALPTILRDTENELNLVREQALRDARAAKDAEQRKNDLVVYLAHDLKTPLTSVIGYLTLLRDEPEISPALRAKYTGIALGKAERLEELINEFFDITRFNLTTLTLARETIDLTRMLEQITYEFLPVLAEKELTWQLHLAPGIRLTCDPDKLERVFDNLFRNAVNYSYPGGAITLSLAEAAGEAVITVENKGQTIPPEKLSRLFEQFFRLDAARATSTGGAGLGLAIAKEIVELHGGVITAESADEEIIFTLRLPLGAQSPATVIKS